MLAADKLIESADVTLVLENQAMYQYLINNVKIESPSYINLNRLVA